MNKQLKEIRKIVSGVIAVGGFIAILAVVLNLLQGTI